MRLVAIHTGEHVAQRPTPRCIRGIDRNISVRITLPVLFVIPVNSAKISSQHGAINGVCTVVTISAKSSIIGQVGAILRCGAIRFILCGGVVSIRGLVVACIITHPLCSIVSPQVPGRGVGVVTWERDGPTSAAVGMEIPLRTMRVVTGGTWVRIHRVAPLSSNKGYNVAQIV